MLVTNVSNATRCSLPDTPAANLTFPRPWTEEEAVLRAEDIRVAPGTVLVTKATEPAECAWNVILSKDGQLKSVP